ncbi:SMP-30/gluconolactonase/LRE family protein [Streptomyces sp. NPDC060053]|uniref:SMP-30/gluconolactonase/LRE family protein n=1 Tax=Streptomyces sp. NPDC060053 TaxID=3347047 RepID=UPI0036B9FFD2
MPRVPRSAGVTAAALALGLLASAPATGDEPAVSAPHVVAHFDLAKGQSPENIALEPDGSADLTFSSARQVVNVTREGRTRILATLPAVANPQTPVVGAAVVLGIARAQNGTLYVNYATGTRATGIWRIPSGGGKPQQIAQLPPTGFPNGLALDERRGVFYVADSVLGTVWRVPRSGGKPTAWATGAALEPRNARPAARVGANGLRVHRDAVWVSNTNAGTLLRIPVRESGCAGAIETRAKGIYAIDDFAFVDRHRDTVLAALTGGSEIAQVSPDGTRRVVLTRKDGLSNPTSVAVRGRTAYVPSAAYFTHDDPNLLLARVHQRDRG